MGPLLIVFLTKLIENPLLIYKRSSGRLSCRLFECAVHALMATVLLGFAVLDPIR